MTQIQKSMTQINFFFLFQNVRGYQLYTSLSFSRGVQRCLFDSGEHPVFQGRYHPQRGLYRRYCGVRVLPAIRLPVEF